MARRDPTPSAPAARPRHALLAGGGTGGHVFPALAVAEELLRRGWTVSFAGSATGLEARLVPARGIPFHALPARPVVGKSAMERARAFATLGRSALAARRLLRTLGADAVLGTGGYASAPAVVGAALARRPALLLEPNARAGAANRWLSRLAAGAAVGYRSARADLECPAWVTGVPVRAAFFAVPERLPDGPPRLLVLGGSQGARQLNETLPAAVALAARELPGLSLLHQAGARDVEATRAAYGQAGWKEDRVEEKADQVEKDGQAGGGPRQGDETPAARWGTDHAEEDQVRKEGRAGEPQGTGVEPRLEVVPFLDDVAGAMASSHLILSRAGAIATAEICAAGRASILVPLAIAQGHQVENARLLAAAGAAEVVTGAGVTAERLAQLLVDLLSDFGRLTQMGKAARALARPDAAAAIADRLEELVGGGAW
jgi:UDP-N-acetylglucosamine--N-acetylmuramyl-(pentapeptide) pyrophosphoryl-undecaprenol N-acetylglucosamine transferase